MKHYLLSSCMLAACIAFLSCEEKEAPLLTGDIHGAVNLVDSYGYGLQDRSGVQVQLSGKDFFAETTTDGIGHYTFADVPFGNYDLNLARENYVGSTLQFHVGHAGGDAPTLISQTMNEIPGYRYHIDSLRYNGISRLYFYLSLAEATRPFASSFIYVHCFFSHSPDVSCDNYENNILEIMVFGPDTGNQVWFYYIFYEGYYRFLEDYAGTVYCRVYPQTDIDEMWYSNDSGPHPCYPQTLGKPSEVYSFTVDGITGKSQPISQ